MYNQLESLPMSMKNKSNGHRPADGKRPASPGAPHPHQQDMSSSRTMQQQGERSDGRRNMSERQHGGGGQGDAGFGGNPRR